MVTVKTEYNWTRPLWQTCRTGELRCERSPQALRIMSLVRQNSHICITLSLFRRGLKQRKRRWPMGFDCRDEEIWDLVNAGDLHRQHGPHWHVVALTLSNSSCSASSSVSRTSLCMDLISPLLDAIEHCYAPAIVIMYSGVCVLCHLYPMLRVR